MPNYPPKAWKNKGFPKDEAITKLVYVGYTLDFNTMFAQELLDWVITKEDELILDCYLSQENQQVKDYLKNKEAKNICLKGKINYFELPQVLPNYNVGLILYKGHIENYVYNAPNKLFEYLACGLDVWFPKEMLGCYSYITVKEYPKVVKVDFGNLNAVEVKILKSRNGLVEKPNKFNCEQVIPTLKDELFRCL